jgi:HPr kinase/phosphorylase
LTDPAGGQPGTALRLHASAAAWCGRGVLLRGEPGSGKSALLAQLLQAGAYLVADDLVLLARRGQTVYATAPSAAGLIELRGNGIFRLATTVGVPVSLCVELAPSSDRERLPEGSATAILAVPVPLLRLDGQGPAAVAQILLALAARRAH